MKSLTLVVKNNVICMYFFFPKEVIIKIMVDCKATVLYKFHYWIIQVQIENFVAHLIYHAVKTFEKNYGKQIWGELLKNVSKYLEIRYLNGPLGCRFCLPHPLGCLAVDDLF